MENKLGIGIDLGGTHIKAVLMEQGGKILQKLSRSTDDTSSNSDRMAIWKKKILEMTELLIQSAGKPVPIGLSAPGLPTDDEKSIGYMPGRLDGLENFDWSSFLPGLSTHVLNDAVAALLAERDHGAGQGYQHVLMLTLGTGVGGALLIHGKPYTGTLHRAGHAGHICLDPEGGTGILSLPGTLEYFVGNATIRTRSEEKYSSTFELVKAYQSGDAFATRVWLDSVKKLALGISSLINVISPEIIIVGGGISQAGKALFDPLASLMAQYEWRPGGVSTPIVAAQMKEYAGAIGAAIYGLEAKKI